MYRLVFFFVFKLFGLIAIGQNFDTIQFSKIAGNIWSKRDFVKEDLIIILDTSACLNFNHLTYDLNSQKSSFGLPVYDTIRKKGIIKLSKYDLLKLRNHLESNIELNNSKSLYNLILNASYSDFKKSLKIKNFDLTYQVFFKERIDKYDLEDLKSDVFVSRYINFLEEKRNSFTFTHDVTNELFIRLAIKGKSLVIIQNSLNDMGQPYYVSKEQDSFCKRYLNIETNEVLKLLIKDFKSFISAFDSKNYLNAYVLWYYRNRWNFK